MALFKKRKRPGFFTRYGAMEQIARPIPPYAELLPLFQAAEGRFSEVLDLIGTLQERFQAIGTEAIDPNWDSDYLTRLDGAGIYAAVVRHRPARIMEVGSGNSTRFFLRAVADEGLSSAITCIDPAPRIELSDLSVRFERRVLSVEDVPLFDQLSAGDIVFLDGSHILQEGFDTDIVFSRIFPRLAAGVVVHIHDIFLPWPYPENWVDRRYNEQLALPGWLWSAAFTLDFATHYAVRSMEAQVRAAFDRFGIGKYVGGGSLWIVKR